MINRHAHVRSGDTLHLRYYADEKNADRGGEWGTAVGLFTHVTSAQLPSLFGHLQVFSDVLFYKTDVSSAYWAVADERWPLWEGREEKGGNERSEGKREEIRGGEERM